MKKLRNYTAFIAETPWRQGPARFIKSSEFGAKSKAEFLRVLKGNGYKVLECHIAEVYEFILHTDFDSKADRKLGFQFANKLFKENGWIDDEKFGWYMDGVRSGRQLIREICDRK